MARTQMTEHRVIDEVLIPPVSFSWELGRGSYLEATGVRADRSVCRDRVCAALDQIAKQGGMRLLWDTEPWKVTIRVTSDSSSLVRRYDIEVPGEVDDEAMADYQERLKVARAEARRSEIEALARIIQVHAGSAQDAAQAIIDTGCRRR